MIAMLSVIAFEDEYDINKKLSKPIINRNKALFMNTGLF